MDKVVFLSLPRTATQSSSLFMHNLGYKVSHRGGPEVNSMPFESRSSIEEVSKILKKSLKKYDALINAPFNVFYEYFDTNYKDCKFVLLTRPFDIWAESIHNMHSALNKKTVDIMDKILFSKYLNNIPELISDITDEDLKIVYNSHLGAVIRYFNDKNNLFISELSDIQDGKKLAIFLNKEKEFEERNISFKSVDHILRGNKLQF